MTKVAERTIVRRGRLSGSDGCQDYMQPGEVLYLYDLVNRKKGWILINSVDGDYYGNPGNEGHIFAQMQNITDQRLYWKVGDRIVQRGCFPHWQMGM